METIIFLLNYILTYCITVDLGNIVLNCKYRVRIEHLFDIFIGHLLGNQPELPSDKGSNRSRGLTRDIGRGSLSE